MNACKFSYVMSSYRIGLAAVSIVAKGIRTASVGCVAAANQIFRNAAISTKSVGRESLCCRWTSSGSRRAPPPKGLLSPSLSLSVTVTWTRQEPRSGGIASWLSRPARPDGGPEASAVPPGRALAQAGRTLMIVTVPGAGAARGSVAFLWDGSVAASQPRLGLRPGPARGRRPLWKS